MPLTSLESPVPQHKSLMRVCGSFFFLVDFLIWKGMKSYHFYIIQYLDERRRRGNKGNDWNILKNSIFHKCFYLLFSPLYLYPSILNISYKKERRAVRGNFYLFLDDLIVGAEEKQILLTICIMYLLECVRYTYFF